MKIRTAYELEESIRHDITWRKREFTTLKFMISSSRKHERLILLKAAITLLYSHWEGHVKHCSLVYLNYLNNIGCSFHKMKDNFLLLGVPEKFKKGFSFNNISSLAELMNYFNTPQTENFKVKEEYVIDTDSNLKFPILFNILQQLGLETKDYELKEHFIDAKMLKCRNTIAHGSILSEKEIEDTYNEIENELLDMIIHFQNLIFKAVDNKEYLKDAC
ncbi:MAE_28990/MAE_18760 family HEPN-like nuclease [Acinetobacter towneri]|uniref:MAE_28990/MAE_18760 family HEPN-like nuclease n=1 Tax=Acinetobacter towneri TaxID=202956 RepID=UPI00209791FF|nr:MAE_28990/MAE_18760 family HEPN-like nuclease [Acinetobacter towneri]MCO8059163.1 MAE_28990/MAE_18760 family HEPN-like nuclease [Acinetobacter towneri]MCO8064897.1 MAE_28990/MAE_18760 family HEPN-like nuclease [Acinetobacter towneri]